MSETQQTSSNIDLSIEKLPVQVSADKDRKRFSGAKGKAGLSSKQLTNIFSIFGITCQICYQRVLRRRKGETIPIF